MRSFGMLLNGIKKSMLVIEDMRLSTLFANCPDSFANNFSHMIFVSVFLINFLYIISSPVWGSKFALTKDGTDKFILKLHGSLEGSRVDVLNGTYSKASFMVFCAFLGEDVTISLLLCGCMHRLYRGDGATLSRLLTLTCSPLVFWSCCLEPLVFQKDFVC